MSSDNARRRQGAVRYGPELRVLIVGAGVAGVTLAGLLEQRGFAPVVVDKAPSDGEEGYVLRLWPAGSRVLKGLGLYPAFWHAGLECTHHNVARSSGELLHSFSFTQLAARYGPVVNIYRPDLIALLRSGMRRAIDEGRFRCGVTVWDVAETHDGVVAMFDDGEEATFDVIVGCDGAHSGLRQLLFDDAVVIDRGMAGWGFSLPASFVPQAAIVEYCGVGKFFGVYPTRDRVWAFAGVRAPAGSPDPIDSRVARLRAQFHDFGGLVPRALATLDRPEAVYHGAYVDVQMAEWFRGRAVLIGDAAHAVPPGGGMGASLAMESAAVLADELCRADSACIDLTFQQYVARRRARVDRVQARSRLLSNLMFTENRVIARLRNGAMQISVDEQLLDFVETVLVERI